MKDKFKKLSEQEKAPEELKDEVFNTIDSLKLFASIVDLFTTKYSLTELTMFDIASENLFNQEDTIKEDVKEKNIKKGNKKSD